MNTIRNKSLLAVCLALLLALSVCPAAFAEDLFTVQITSIPAGSFADVPGDAPYAAAVRWAKDEGVTDGTGPDSFDPSRAATRAEAVTFLWRANGCPAPANASSPFTDLAEDWYRDAVLWAAEQGITEGVSADAFAPDEPVTRTQMAAFLYRANGEPGKTGEGEWYADAVKWAFGRILVFGNALPLGSEDDTCLRSDAVTYLYRLSQAPEPEANGDVVILYTSDVHCGIDRGFGYAGLYSIREALEEQGYATVLVDDGDAIQGEMIGTLTKGEAIVRLMNDLRYDVAIPGNHEFTYGMERFLELTEMAGHPYISCNFNREGELVFDPYTVVEAAGKKIAFVGVTTPESLISSTPASFQNDAGEFVYGFFQEGNGEGVYAAVQSAVDAARAEGADYVYVLGHLGNEETCRPWTYADVIAHTGGIDVLFDGHSHDTDQVVMTDRDGRAVVRSACGTKLAGVGYSRIAADGTIAETGIWSWTNPVNAAEAIGIENSIRESVDAQEAELSDMLETVVARASVVLTIHDPVAQDSSGKPVRIVRRAETNLGDLCADAIREASGADVAVMNGGGIRTSIAAGDVTYGDIVSVFPFGNGLCVLEVTGQQILDALEWGARAVPGESGGFLQVSGMSYEIDPSVPDGCVAGNEGQCVAIEGERRVRNVLVAGKPIDPAGTYTLAGFDYTLLDGGDGFTAFNGAPILQNRVKLDNLLLIDYIAETLGGEVGERYADPYGEGRIRIVE